MPTTLGVQLAPAAPPAPSGDERRHQELRAELVALRQVLEQVVLAESTPTEPAQIVVPPSDLTEVVEALSALERAPLDVNALADAVATAVGLAMDERRVEVPDRADDVIAELKKIGSRFGRLVALTSPIVAPDISDRPDRKLGRVEVTNFPPVVVSQEISNDVGNPVPVSGTVAVSNFPASVEVANDVGSPIPVTGTVTTTGTSTVAVTDQRTSATLTAAAPDTTTGIATTTGVVVVPSDGKSGFSAQIIASTSPAWVGSVITEYSLDNGQTWTPTAWRQSVTGSTQNTLLSTQTVALGTYTGGLLRGSAAGATHYRVRQATRTAGSVTVNLVTHQGTGAIFSNTVLDTRELFQYLCSAAGRRVGFNATTDGVSLATATAGTQSLFAVFSNPSTSTVDATIYKIEFGSNVPGRVRRFRNGAITIPTGQNPRPSINRAGGLAVAQSMLYGRETILTVTTQATGGTVTKLVYLNGASDDPDLVNGTLTVRPGENLYWTFTPNANPSATSDVALNLIWAETAAQP